MNDIERSIVSAISKEMGKESIRIMSDKHYERLDVIPTGSAILDEALGIGGWPRGRAIECWGTESCGKSTLVCHAIANCQKLGFPAALVDSEHAYDPSYGEALGIDNSRLIVTQADSAEDQFKIIKRMISSGCKLICLDSIAALITSQELNAEEGSANIAALARLLSAQYKVIIPLLSINNCCLLQTNQIREKPGVLYGSPETTPGGRSVRFYASIRVRFAAREKTKEKVVIDFKVHKNKCARPFQEGKFTINYGTGINKAEDLLSVAISYGIIEKRGSSYFMTINGKETRIGVGKAKVLDQLTDKRMDMISRKIKEAREAASEAAKG